VEPQEVVSVKTEALDIEMNQAARTGMFTSPRRQRPGSIRSSDGSPNWRESSYSVAFTVLPKNWKPTSTHSSKVKTKTQPIQMVQIRRPNPRRNQALLAEDNEPNFRFT
tara:strand:- start:49 stop:375 length:327 start_codon:yes stop_codon:yes gene_type:complete